jgi:molybdopterin converting factor small subunit
MIIDVHYTTQLRAALGQAQQRVTIDDGATLDQLLQQLADDQPEVFSRLVLDAQGQLLPNIILCVDDQQVTAADRHVLHDGAQVTLLSAISGG